LKFKRENITGRTTDKNKLGARPKVLLRKTGNSIIATYDDSGVFPEQSLYFLYDFRSLSPLYLLGVLNSALMSWYYKRAALTNKDSIAQVKKVQLDELPIRRPEKSVHDKTVAHVSSMLSMNLGVANSVAQRAVIQRQIDATDAEINRIVFDLYGLTAEEIAIVEQADATPIGANQ
jgi:TaqI-like C-terminal specificity domain